MAGASGHTTTTFPTGRDVSFPYKKPYQQQLDLMDCLLKGLQHKYERDQTGEASPAAVMLLESPTGTGKSLSLACASLAWLKYRDELDLQPCTTAGPLSAPSDLDWLDAWVSPSDRDKQEEQNKVQEQARQAKLTLEKELTILRERIADDDATRKIAKRNNLLQNRIARVKQLERQHNKKRKRQVSSATSSGPKSDNYALTDYRSDEGKSIAENEEPFDENVDSGRNPLNSDSARRLDGSYSLNQLSQQVVIGSPTGIRSRKIIYAARTHSQLSQFVHEVRRTEQGQHVRLVALGSRSALCGHAQLSKLSDRALNEACLDWQSTKTDRCPLLGSKAAVQELALHTLVEPTDIEQAAHLGRQTQTCAYYASRVALEAAQVVVLPYSMLLSAATRQAIGLKLHECLIIVDEAHNLPQALTSLHSCRLSLPVIEAALDQLSNYVAMYLDRLAGRNLFYLGQIRKVLVALKGMLLQPPADNRMRTSSELLMDAKIDNVNLFKVLRYLKHSRLSQKLLGFTTQALQKNNQTIGTIDGPGSGAVDADSDPLSKHISAMSIVETFLEKLALSTKEGKMVIEHAKAETSGKSSSTAALRYVLLHPANFLENLLQEAHAVALVGGTLRPFGQVAAELLPDVGLVQQAALADTSMQHHTNESTSRAVVSAGLTAFSCDHVVPSSHVLLQCWAHGPTGQVLDFRHGTRASPAVCDELGHTVLRICRAVPAGVVVFVASYAYEDDLFRRWTQTGLWQTLNAHKKIHREPKRAQQIDAALQLYAKDASSGALLLSVMGGKLSEGINFANDLARCVIVVGLPYPDIADPELREKMASLDASANKHLVSGRDYYHSLCMRAVNQSAGRAIRHAADYAAIVLLDARYTTDARIWKGLPQWLKRGGLSCQRDLPVAARVNELEQFFAERLEKLQESKA